MLRRLARIVDGLPRWPKRIQGLFLSVEAPVQLDVLGSDDILPIPRSCAGIRIDRWNWFGV